MEIEKLQQEFELDVQWAPFLLDPFTPPEGKPRKGMTSPGDEPTPLEQRGVELGITFSRGRSWTSNSLLALQAADFLAEHPARDAFHRAMFESYFTDLSDIGEIDTVLAVAESVGVETEPLSEILENGAREESVRESLALAHEIGITAVPTFVIDEQYAIVGAQEYTTLRDVLTRLGKQPRQGEA